MKSILKIFILLAMLVSVIPTEAAKKYKVDFGHPMTVKMTGVSTQGYFVKAWAVAKNADKAMEQARMDAVMAALQSGIEANEAAEGAGVTNLPALMTPAQFNEHKLGIEQFFTSGEFLNYVKDVSSTYPKGSDNVKTPDGRKVGLSMVLNYVGLRNMLQERGWIKGINDHFEYKGI